MNLSRLFAALAPAALFTLAACGGGGGSAGGAAPPSLPGGAPPPVTSPAPGESPTAAPTSGPIGTSSSIIDAEENFTNPDTAGWYTAGTASWTAHAGDTVGGNNGNGDTCDLTMTSEPTGTYFHSHAFVGIFYNGSELALPQAIGMENPVEPTKGSPSHPSDSDQVENATCMFHVHTHDFSGLVHIEVPTQPFDPTYQALPGYANLQTLMDIWGATLTGAGLTAGSDALDGTTSVYTGLPTAKDASGNDLVKAYTPVTGAASSVMLAHHAAIWIVIGTPPAALPQVAFVVQN